MVDSGDTAWVLASAALVLFMTPGLALFYGGLVRSKNVLGTMMHSVAAIAIVSVVWLMIGYSLAFGPDVGGVIGGLAHLGLGGVSGAPSVLAPTVPHTAFVAFQLMFAVITPALIAGAFAERVRFGGYVAFIALWSLLVYSPIAHWVWGGGFLGADGIGALDFAGGTVVHISAGAAARIHAGTSRRTTCRWSSSAPGSSGSDGSASMPVARWPRTVWRRPRSSRPISGPWGR
jgi:Amt family ammonium transporter